MITRSTQQGQRPGTWQHELANAIRDPAELLAALQLNPRLLKGTRAASEPFHLLVPRSFVRRMYPQDPRDPLLLQVLPQLQESLNQPGYSHDPVGDESVHWGAGVLCKYSGRALLITTGACAIHCRYCFRRSFPYQRAQAALANWQPAMDLLRTAPEINEVILSGGDPLVLSDARLSHLFEQLAEIPHVRRLRIHSRLPVVLPSRLDEGFLQLLQRVPAKTLLVIHTNHPNELDQSVGSALAKLSQAGLTLLNQSVLLAGINDTVQALVELSERLFHYGVLPYYLHMLDPVTGSAHFAVDEARARALYGELQAQLPGYLVPRFVREVPGERSKRLINPP